MANAIANVGHAAPQHAGVLGLQVVRNVARGLADEFKAALDPKLPETVGPQLFCGHAKVFASIWWMASRIWVIPASLIHYTLPPRYVIPAEAGTQVTYPLGIVEFFATAGPPLRCDLDARLRGHECVRDVALSGWCKSSPWEVTTHEAEGNCVAARRGGEQPEANEQPAGERTRFGGGGAASLLMMCEARTGWSGQTR
jgi:hypothetical protein